MRAKNLQAFFLILLKINFAVTSVSNDSACDETKNCGTNISEKECRKRGCCYINSTERVNQCVQKRKDKNENSNNLNENRKFFSSEGDILPPGAVQISDQLSSTLKKLKLTGNQRLLPSQTIQVTHYLDDYLKYAAQTGSKDFNWKMSHEGIFYANIKRNRLTFNNSLRLQSGAIVEVGPSDGYDWNETIALIFVEYLTLGKDYQSLKKESRKLPVNPNKPCRLEKEVMNSLDVVSVKAYDSNWEELPVVLKFSFGENSPIQANSANQPRISCEFLNKTSREWSSDGCAFESGECSCNNTSKFTGIFAAKPVPLETKPAKLTDIQVMEFVMESLASGFLLVTLISLIFALRRRSKSYTSATVRAKERTVIHINFVAAMAALHLTKLAGETMHANYVLCATAVVLSRYFMLVGGMWMLIESFILHVNVIAKGLKQSKMGCYKFIAGWLVPAAIALTTAAIGFSTGSYVEKQDSEDPCEDTILMRINAVNAQSSLHNCWLSTESNLLWSAMGPLIGIFVINFFILGHTIIYVLWLSAQAEVLKPTMKKSKSVHHIWHATKGILVLIPILGIPWMIDFYVKTSDYRVSSVVQYTHVILNGVQGFSLFILYCGLNQKTQKSLKKVANNTWKQHKASRPGSGCNISLRKKFRPSDTGSRCGYNQHITNNTIRLINQRKTNPNSCQPFYKALQKPQAASFSTNSSFLHFKTKRNYSFAPVDPANGMRSTSRRISPELIGVYNSKASEKDTNISILPGVKPDPGEPAMISFSFDDGRQEQANVAAFKPRWRRTPSQDFRRFSAIPEELRHDVDIESLVVENIENVKLCRANEKIKSNRNRETIKVDVHMNDKNIINSIKSKKSCVYFENRFAAKRNLSPNIKPDRTNDKLIRN